MRVQTLRLSFIPLALAASTVFALAQKPAASTQPATIKLELDPLPEPVIERRLGDFAPVNTAREAHLKQLFEAAGCKDDHLTQQLVRPSLPSNLICTLPGTTDSVIIVGAHFDKVRTGDGVVDNWSGASLLPSLYQSLLGAPRRHTFVFIGFTDEEGGLVGSKFYARHLTPAMLARVHAMINMDSLGLGPTKLWLHHSDPRLAADFDAVAAALHVPVGVVNADSAGDDDSESFMKLKVHTLMIHSVTNATWSILHSRRDTLAAIKLPDYYDTYRLVAAYLPYIDTAIQ